MVLGNWGKWIKRDKQDRQLLFFPTGKEFDIQQNQDGAQPDAYQGKFKIIEGRTQKND